MARESASPRRAYVRFTRWRRAHFFRVLEETGHVKMAAEAAGVSLACIYRLRRVEAGFAGKMSAAVAKADARLAAEGDAVLSGSGERVPGGAYHPALYRRAVEGDGGRAGALGASA